MKTLCRRSFWFVLLAILCVPNLVMADDSNTKLVIPDYPAAKDQFAFATMYEKSQFLAPELKQRKAQLAKVAQCYQRVIDNFPQDPVYVPRAYMQLGDCAARAAEPDKALQYYQYVKAHSTSDEFLQARATFSIGQVLDMKKEYEAAKATYKEVMDHFGTSNVSGVKSIVRQASVLYLSVHEQPAKTSKWNIKHWFGKGDSANN